MKLKLGGLSRIARRLKLAHTVDNIRFNVQKAKNRKKNKLFKKRNPTVKLPPDYMMYESFKLNYASYYNGGKQTAQWVESLLDDHKRFRKKKILDWGCGPARIVRHLPDVFGRGCTYFGTDYNEKTIQWCKENIEGVSFEVNGINPPLKFEDNFFDAVYGISIFTHLSPENHQAWYDELMRVCKKGAVLLFTTHGGAFKSKMSKKERAKFDRGELVVRAEAKEGHRVYAAFHPPAYIEKLFSQKSEIVKHKAGRQVEWGIEQDYWILKKK